MIKKSGESADDTQNKSCYSSQEEILHCQLCKWQVQDGTITQTKEFESARKTDANTMITRNILMN